MNAFLQTLRNLGPMRLAAIAVVAFSLLGFFGFLTTRISSSPMALLYSDLDQQDAGAIVQKLDGLKIPYETPTSGGMIRVPAEQVAKVRMLMAADGLPKGGSIGYEIFDQKEGFGTTSFVQNINHLRALEGELARTISTMTVIQTARVHLVLPQRELFSHGTQIATASVFLKTRGGVTLTREQIAAIENLIAAAVPQLQPTQISIVDDKGTLLARPASSDAAGTGNQDDMRAGFEQTQARKIEDLLSQSIGFGKVRAKVSAELDFDKITTSSEIYDPDSQVIRSTQTTSENTSSAEGANESVSITNNLPANPTPGSPGGENNSNKSEHSEETVNYEINKTVRSQVRESGQVKRLSVAVVVDGITTTAADGTESYQPRTPEEMDQIKSLVRSSVNYDANRGDTLEVINMRFLQAEGGKSDESSTMMMGVPKADLLRMIETLLLAIIGLLVVLLVVRPILRRIFESAGSLVPQQQQQLLASGAGSGAAAQLPPPGTAFNRELQDESEESDIERMIDISRVEGRVKASSLRKVGEIVDKHPEEAVSILRNWIYQENR
ncbi:MAG: flagellar basal-body MS-ring/collar protein FliF [Alphaproteobacteria bacterium]|nr:flagellar basal-body MS-ring/collar protein FliF [Alphaproteobacteria bacterium]